MKHDILHVACIKSVQYCSMNIICIIQYDDIYLVSYKINRAYYNL